MTVKQAARQRTAAYQAYAAAQKTARFIIEVENSISLTGDKDAKLYQLHCEAARHFATAASLEDSTEGMFRNLDDANYHSRAARRYQP